jgi:hypothetical protein
MPTTPDTETENCMPPIPFEPTRAMELLRDNFKGFSWGELAAPESLSGMDCLAYTAHFSPVIDNEQDVMNVSGCLSNNFHKAGAEIVGLFAFSGDQTN